MSKVGWHFQHMQNGSWKGFNDGDIAHFKGDRYGSLAREIIQNSLDAVDDKTLPVEISFSLTSVLSSEVPNHEELTQKFVSSQPFAKQEKEEAGIFFDEAINLLRQKKVSVLKVSEKNTKGMPGPCEFGNPFFAYMKATGQSQKGSDTATGSHGIGKKAPLTTSRLRTVFVSTVWREGNTKRVALQGIATLMSHSNSGKTYDGIGYWGIVNDCLPIQTAANIPLWLKRKDVGTDFFILAFREKKNWESQLVAAVAKNFFAAISRKKLVVRVGSRVIDSSNISVVFEDEKVVASIAELKGEPDGFLLSRQFLACERRKPGAEKFVDSSEVTHLGNCQVQMLVEPGLGQRVCVLRNNMLITTDLDKLRVFRNMKDFVAIVECRSDDGVRLLRAMEPARHDSFDPDQFETEENARKGALALRKLAEWVRGSLKKHAQVETTGGGAIDFLSDLFQEELEDGTSANLERNPEGKLIFQPKPIKTPTTISPSNDGVEEEESEEDDEGSGGPGGNNGGGNGGSDSDNSGNNNEKTGDGMRKQIQLNDVRTITTPGKETRVFFTPDKSGEVDVRVFAIGADAEDGLEIITSDAGLIVNGAVRTKIIADKRTRLLIETRRQSVGGIKVTANEV